MVRVLPIVVGLLATLCLVHAAGDPVAATQGLVSRLLGPDYVSKFSYEAIPADPATGHDVFEIESQGAVIALRGNTGVAMASGLGWYLKYTAGCDWSWGLNRTGLQVSLPDVLPSISSPIRMVRPVKYSYYQNVCTVSYSMAWWDWERWQNEIDWMALNGINLPLSFTGQEYVWYQFYTKLGATDEEILTYFSGAAFLAWQRMGNIRGWGGPMDADWRSGQANLQQQILNRTREYGMINVLPGFSGHVPAAIKRLYPNATLFRSHSWGGFNETYTEDYVLEPTDPLFQQLGQQWYETLISVFGTDNVYNSDTYNEMEPSSTNLQFLADSNEAVYNAMKAADPNAIYLMQGWLFHEGFWTSERVKAYLSAVPDDKMLILDLNSDESPLWNKFDNFFGKSWIWCMLHNYGGRRGLYGDVDEILSQPVIAKKTAGAGMAGVGITPEAIEQNPVMYEAMSEMSWRNESVNASAWISSYATRRYGGNSPSAQAAWEQLHAGAYHQNGIDVSEIEQSPAVGTSSGHSTNATAILEAWRYLQAAAKEVNPAGGPYLYDLTDVGRQVLSNFFADVHTLNELAFQRWQFLRQNSSVEVAATSALLQSIIKDMDTLLGSNVNFLLGNWIEDAKKWGKTADEINNKEFNARNQITLWGPSGQINDYAAKHWAGLVGDYYGGRWNLLLTALNAAVYQGQPMDFNKYSADLLKFEQAWGFEHKVYPTTPTGDTAAISSSLLQKYASSSSQYTVKDGIDYPGNDITRAWTKDLAQLKILCDAYESCVGFNSNGYLKNSTSSPVSSPSVFYLKN
eukprot:m.45743 g.45743  ORF g.45743 m.45743 type:complete len:799 (+) comp17449_c0_seq1:3-2399(+)